MQPDPSAADPAVDPGSALDALLDRLAAAVSGGVDTGHTSTGSDAAGYVTAVLDGRGRVQQLELDPRILRDRDAVAGAIRQAVNEAVDARPAAAPTGERTAELRAIQEQSLEVSRAMNGSLLAALEQLK